MNSNCNIEEIGRIGNCSDNGEKSVNSKEKKRKCKKSSMTNKIESAFDCPQSLQDNQWLWRQKLQNNRRRQSQLAHLTMLLQPSTQKNDSNQNNNLDYSYNHNTNNTNHKHNSKNNNNNNNNNNENENENENSSESSDINNSKSNNNSDNRYNFEQNGKTTNHPNKPAIACKSVQRGKSTLMNENSIDNSVNNNENEIHINCQQLLKFGCPSHDLAPALMHCNYNVPNYLICNGYSVDCCNFDNNINKMCEIKCWNFQQLGVTFRRFLSSENPLTIQILENNSLSMGKCMDIELLRTGEGVFPKKFRPGMYKFDGKSKKSQTKNDKKNKRENKTENKSDNKLGTWFEGKLFYIRKNDKIVLSGLNDNSIKFVFELYCDLTNKKNKDGLNDIIGGIGLCQLNGKNKIYGIRNCLLLRSEESELFNVLQKSKLKVFVDPQKITLLKQKNLKVIVNGINELNLNEINEMNGKYTSDHNHFNIKQESPSLARNINENIDLPKLQECDSNDYNICNKDMIPLIPTTLQFCSNNGLTQLPHTQLPLTSMHIPSVMNLNSIETEMAYLDYTNMNMNGNGNGNGNISFGNFINDNELNMTSFGELKHIFNGNSLIHPNGNEMIGYPQLFEYSNVSDINNNNSNNILGINSIGTYNNTDTNSNNNNNNNNNVSECVNMFELNALNQRQTSFNSLPSLSSSSDSMSSNSGSSIGPCCQSNIQCNMPCNIQCNTQGNGMTDSSSVMSQCYNNNNNNNNNNNHNGENDEISQFEQFESGFEQCHQFEEFGESFEKEPPLKRRRKLNNCNDNTNNNSNSYNYNCCNNGIVSIADCDNGYFNLFTHNATTN